MNHLPKHCPYRLAIAIGLTAVAALAATQAGCSYLPDIPIRIGLNIETGSASSGSSDNHRQQEYKYVPTETPTPLPQPSPILPSAA